MSRILFAVLLFAEVSWNCTPNQACESEQSGCDPDDETGSETAGETEGEMPDIPDNPDMGG